MTNEEKAKEMISMSNTNQVYDMVDFNALHEALYEDLMEMAEWKEKQMIEKACEWLEYNFNMPSDFKEHFTKAMED